MSSTARAAFERERLFRSFTRASASRQVLRRLRRREPGDRRAEGGGGGGEDPRVPGAHAAETHRVAGRSADQLQRPRLVDGVTRIVNPTLKVARNTKHLSVFFVPSVDSVAPFFDPCLRLCISPALLSLTPMAKRKPKSGSLFDGDADVVDTTPPGGGIPRASRCTRRPRPVTSTTRSRSSPRARCPTFATGSSRCSAASSTRCGSRTSPPTPSTASAPRSSAT